MGKSERFEKELQTQFGIPPVETRLLLKIADGMIPELMQVLRGTDIAKDMDALLILTRLTEWEQGWLVYYLGEGLLPELAVQLASTGQLQKMLAEDAG